MKKRGELFETVLLVIAVVMAALISIALFQMVS